MCKESLINYLHARTEEEESSSGLTKGDIKDLIDVGEIIAEHDSVALEKRERIENGVQKSSDYLQLLPDEIHKNAQALDAWLENITVCDPAVGSGAFPVGMISEIVRARKVLSVFLEDGRRSEYEFKRRCIERSLYGVDVAPGAVEIARLRRWLSLIVDEEDINNIKPLPNLDYRVIQGNSLLSEFMGVDFDTGKEKNTENLMFKDKSDELIEQFQQKKKEFLNESNVSKKMKLREKVDDLLIKIFNAKVKNKKARCSNKLKSIESKYSMLPNEKQKNELIKKEKEKLNKDSKFNLKTVEKQLKEFTSGKKIKPFFLWELYFSEVFHNKGGFDVVIANPPYVKENTNKNAFNGLRDTECYQGKMDLWYLFGCNGLNILKQHGIMCFIATNNWISNDGASKFRNKVIKNGRLISFIDFCNYKVFTAGIQTMIYLIAKDDEPPQYQLSYGKLFDDNADLATISDFLSSKTEILTPNFLKYPVVLNRKSFVDTYIKFIHPIANGVLNKIKKEGTFYLADDEIFSGIDVMQDFVSKTNVEKLGGFDVGTGVFVINNKEKASRPWNRKELEIIKPYYTTKEVNRYYANSLNKYWIFYTGVQINRVIKNYPNIKKHLDQFKNIITSVNKPYGLHRTRKERIFLGDKILSIRKCPQPSFAYVDYPCYVARSFLILKSNRINLKFLLGILNAKLIRFWLYEKGKLQGNLFQVDKTPLQTIPIKIEQKEAQNSMIMLVN